jgi:hypothetical protein
MHNNCYWLPPTIPQNRGELTSSYLDRLYDIFNADFNLTKPQFLGKDVIYVTNPKIGKWEQSFYHITTFDDHNTNFQNRVIDYARAERIAWIRKVIENYQCKDGCCNGLKIYKVKNRIHILFEKENYIVVLEQRNTNYVLVTAYKFTKPLELEKKLKQYEYYKNIPI